MKTRWMRISLVVLALGLAFAAFALAASADGGKAMAEAFPAGEFPYLREALLGEADPCASFERDFEFGLRALAKGLLS